MTGGKKMTNYYAVEDADPNNTFSLEAATYEKAVEEALTQLGWTICEDKEEVAL